jgi:hypothetical protein
MIRTATFNGIVYNIDVSVPVDGLTDPPKPGGRPTLAIFADLGTRSGLITALHESMHAICWSASEEKVDQAASEIGNFLWRLGYRHE